jgi:hypothetical protein
MPRAHKLKSGQTIVDGPRKHRVVRVVTPAACKQYGMPKTHVIVGDSSKGETVFCYDSQSHVEVTR